MLVEYISNISKLTKVTIKNIEIDQSVVMKGNQSTLKRWVEPRILLKGEFLNKLIDQKGHLV